MSQLALTLSLLAATLAGCATAPEPRPLIVAPSPVTFDGDVAGKAADIVFTLVADPNPATPGIALKTGESLQLGLPAAFKRNAAVAIDVDADTNVALTKGWPQGAVRLVGQYRIRYDADSNAMILTATQDVPADGANAPGIKAIHLRGRSFINPMPGTYVASVTQSSHDGTPLARWEGRVSVLEAAPLARLATKPKSKSPRRKD